jgi:serine/threonine-protein kinase
MTSANEDDRSTSAFPRTAAAAQALTEAVAEGLLSPTAGELAGRFVVEAIIGEGGSGRVLRARHSLLGTPLALKMLSHSLALSPGGARAFIREASILVHLDHPGIVRVLDVFAAHDTFFIVMPWLEGATLRDHIDGGREFDPNHVLALAEELLDALVVLHGAGLVHRDVKPSNVLIKPSGRMVLIDFGIACQRDRPTSARQLVGSPAYCSPEQILGRPLDGRSDVYSLGCALYEIVFGQPPFVADDIDGVLDGHLHGAPRFDITPKVPMGDPFLRWLRGCMSRTRAHRPDAASARAQLSYLIPQSLADRSSPRARVTVPVPMFLLTGEYSTNP